jgi:hypothetical protein
MSIRVLLCSDAHGKEIFHGELSLQRQSISNLTVGATVYCQETADKAYEIIRIEPEVVTQVSGPPGKLREDRRLSGNLFLWVHARVD